jgi:hypothetical protein
MPFDFDQVVTELERSRDDIRKYLDQSRSLGADYADEFSKLLGLSSSSKSWRGNAEPLETIELHRLGVDFHSREEQLDWASKALRGKTVVGIDGSQINPIGLNFPLALLQVGYLCVDYDHPESYRHNRVDVVLPPQEVVVEREGHRSVSRYNVDLARLSLEFKTAGDRVNELGSQDIYIMLDMPLVISYVDAFYKDIKEKYIQCLSDFLRRFEGKATIIGYVDGSAAKDMTDMLNQTLGLQSGSISDRTMLGPYLTEFGERTSTFLCHRQIVENFPGLEDRFAFFYVRVGSRAIGRVEFLTGEGVNPRSIHDLVCAQCVLGEGYPYVLSRAHEAAVIHMPEREQFRQILRGFLMKNFPRIEVEPRLKDQKKETPVS